jgi:hypothetical protein
MSDQPFLLPIEEAFGGAPGGTVVAGRILRGSVRVGDELEIVGLGATKKATVLGIETSRKLIEVGTAGQEIGILLGGTTRMDVERGKMLATPGSIGAHHAFAAKLQMRTTEEGGREAPFRDGYRPYFWFWTYNCGGTVGLPPERLDVKPGEEATVRIELLVSVACEVGMPFSVGEADRKIVGDGIVTEVVDLGSTEPSAAAAPDVKSRRARRRAVVVTALAALAVAGVQVYRAVRPPVAPPVQISRPVQSGRPAADWTTLAKVIASLPGHVHCFSLVDERTVRLIWGSPRRAEDVAVGSGERRPASLVRDAYSTGCPELAPDRHALLFTVTTATGAGEIRHSTNPEGRDAQAVAPGWNPLWLPNGAEFVYRPDAAQVAVFSLATMKSRLLEHPDLGVSPSILGTAVGTRSASVAVMYYTHDGRWVVTIDDGSARGRRATFAVPGARNFRFAASDDTLFISPLEASSPLTALDWRKGTLRNVGRYGEMDLVDALVAGPTVAVLARRRSKDVWLHEPSGKRRLTTDGLNDGAALSVSGELLLARPGPDSTEDIWLREPGGALRKVTNGQHDTNPEFSPDGRTWIYVDYDRRSIMTCTSGADACHVLRHDETLPVAPRFSPDGSKVAYVRLGAVSQLMAFSVSTGKEWRLGRVYWQCPPVWASSDRIWVFEESSSGGYAWVEKELETDLRTGRRLSIAQSSSGPDEDFDCWPKDVDAASPFFSRPRVETRETSSLLGLPSSQLGDPPS